MIWEFRKRHLTNEDHNHHVISSMLFSYEQLNVEFDLLKGMVHRVEILDMLHLHDPGFVLVFRLLPV